MPVHNPAVDFYFDKASQWQECYILLRKIIQECDVEETLKWGQPCYTVNNKNIILIHGFKEYCALLFFKGALMKDIAQILIQQTENTQATRQIRFTNTTEIKKAKKSNFSLYKRSHSNRRCRIESNTKDHYCI